MNRRDLFKWLIGSAGATAIVAHRPTTDVPAVTAGPSVSRGESHVLDAMSYLTLNTLPISTSGFISTSQETDPVAWTVTRNRFRIGSQ